MKEIDADKDKGRNSEEYFKFVIEKIKIIKEKKMLRNQMSAMRSRINLKNRTEALMKKIDRRHLNF